MNFSLIHTHKKHLLVLHLPLFFRCLKARSER